MIRDRVSILWFLPLVALVVLADECVKFIALQRLPDESALVQPEILAYAIHKNWGIAFDIPFKMPFVVAVSVLIGAALLFVAYRNMRTKPVVTLAALMIVVGAAGNLYDRLTYGFTVDYIILFRRSAINVSDIVIVTGVVLLLYASRVRKHGHSHD